MYANGKGTSQNNIKAAEFYAKSCDKAEALGCINLGIMYAKGQFVTQDIKIAKKLFRKACDEKSDVGCSLYQQLESKGY